MHRMSRAGGNPHVFSSAALRRIYSLSKGTPRLINVIADRSLLGAYTLGRHQVNARIVSRAAREVLGQPPNRRAWWAAAATAVFAAGAAWAILVPLGQQLPPADETTGNTASTPTEVRATRTETGEAATTPEQTTPSPEPGPTAPAREPVAQDSSRPNATYEQTSEPVLEPLATNPPLEETQPGAASEDEIITPETYARMQAAARREAESAPRLNPQSVPGASSARAATEIARPAGNNFTNQRLAYAAVFQRWGVTYNDAGSDQIPCDFAPSASLQCLSRRGSWTQIAQMDLPVILELWDGRPAPYHAALLGMDEGRILLGIGSETVETTQRALRDQWAGSFVVLWQTPPGYYGNLRSGQQHETVGWLRLQLGSLVDRSLSTPTPNLFDKNLEQAVLEFQIAEGLTADGIVGPATWIRLATRLNLPQPSLAG
jgi:general secretion pathway protein A